MAKKRTRTEVEHLRGVVRELKSEVKQLRRKHTRSNKKLQHYEEYVDDVVATVTEEDFVQKGPCCPECDGALDIIDLGIKDLWVCEDCGLKRTQAKKKS